MVYTVEKTLKESGDKADKATKDKVEKEIADMKEALKGTDSAKIKAQLEKLQAAVYEMSAQIYKAQGGPNQTPPPQEGKKDEKTVDADYEIKDDK